MDNSWLFENEEEGEEEESDEDEKQLELEERLYAVVHHNDLSQPLPSELARHYSIQHAGDGEIEVTLNNSLEEVQSAECEQISNLLPEIVDVDKTNIIESVNVDDDVDVVIISDDEKDNKITPKQDSKLIGNNNVRKRFRYSDINLDELESKECSKESTPYINYFGQTADLFKNIKMRSYKDLKVPPPRSFDWQKDANSSYISVGCDEQGEEGILPKMTNALVELNPGVSRSKLFKFARALYLKNVQLHRKRMKRKIRKAKKQADKTANTDLSPNSSGLLIDDKATMIKELSKKIEELKRNPKCRKVEQFNGSISLNISSFRPDQTIPSDADFDSSGVLEGSSPSTVKFKKEHFPTKWTKEMIKFYTKPSKKSLGKEIDEVIEDLKKKTTKKNWQVDPRDKTGKYQRSHVVLNKQRCENCNERGHTVQNCYRPIKLPACSLCGELYHSAYSCPHQICWKCGAFLLMNTNGNTCNDCYFSSFTTEEPCTICGEVTHKTANCTDLWRSFHATTGGEKKIPDTVKVNKRKSCCNCARSGHFSHDCPFISYSGQQVSSFVKNYSAKPSDLGAVDVTISKNYAEIMYSVEADEFLHYLSDYTNAVITVSDQGDDIVCNVNGTFDQCKRVKSEIESFVNSRKRKRQEPKSKRKRQRVRF